MADMVWAENERLPGRKIQITPAQFKVYRRNGWVLADPPPPPDPQDDADIEAAVEKAKAARAPAKKAPAKKSSSAKK